MKNTSPDAAAKVVETSETGRTQDIPADMSTSENVSFCNSIFAEAFILGASDIHIEPFEKAFRVRLRVDGKLRQVGAGPMSDYPLVTTRFKVLANLDIAERRRPQEGRLRMKIEGQSIDYRMSVVPTLYGEKIVLRIIDASGLTRNLNDLGMSDREAEEMHKAISKQNGLCLVTGPTGCGKTTTLYSAIGKLNQLERNVTTIEDPVEFNLFGVNQVNVRKDLGFDFAESLRLLMRQDPDVILLGEIRDSETAKAAFQAALTGHLVLSTVHTNDTVATIARLRDMGVEPFLIATGLNVIFTQRLARRICDDCKKPADVSSEQLKALKLSDEFIQKSQFMVGTGCDACRGTGFRGRVGIFEMLRLSSSIKEMIFKNASTASLRKQASNEGMRSLRSSALRVAARGTISLDEASLHANT